MLRSIFAISLALTASSAAAEPQDPATIGAAPGVATGGTPTASVDVQRPKQLLLISFDGAHDNRLWQRSRAIAKRSNARFTYFLSCTTLIPRERASTYQGPGKKAGRSNIGYAPSVADVTARLDNVWSAHLEGHEIANHTCGHFDGKDWSKQDWLTEMTSFDRVLANAWKDNGLAEREPAAWAEFVAKGIVGFRAPYLSAPKSLYDAERDHGFRYDASPVTRDPLLPTLEGEVTRFGLPLIPEGPRQRRIVAMDYNLFIRHSAGIDHPSKAAEFEARSYDAFRAAFDRQYNGDRIPLQIGLHFVEMNGGAYWAAMERLVGEVCHKPDVACVTYAEALDLLQKQSGREPATSSF